VIGVGVGATEPKLPPAGTWVCVGAAVWPPEEDLAVDVATGLGVTEAPCAVGAGVLLAVTDAPLTAGADTATPTRLAEA